MSRSRTLRCGACPNRGNGGNGSAHGCRACAGWRGQRALPPLAGRHASDVLARRSCSLWTTVGLRWRCRQASRASSIGRGRTQVHRCARCLMRRLKHARTYQERADTHSWPRAEGSAAYRPISLCGTHTHRDKPVRRQRAVLASCPRVPHTSQSTTRRVSRDPPALPTTERCRHGHAPGWRWPRRAARSRAAPRPRRAARPPPAAAAAAAAARGARPPEPSRRRG